MVTLQNKVFKKPVKDKAGTALKTISNRSIQERIKELRENTDFMSTLLENLVGYAIIAADFEGNIIAYNDGARQIYGFTPEEVIGKQGIETLFPREYIEAGQLRKMIDELVKQGRHSFEGEKVRKNGECFPAQILFILTRDGSGKAVGFVEMVEDLTGRKRTEKRLVDSMSNYFKVIKDDPDGIIITNFHELVRYVNPAAELLFGRRSNDFYREQFCFPISPDSLSEVHITRKTGETLVAEMRVANTTWYGEIAHLISLHNITERKQAEQAQERFSQQLQAKVSEMEAFSYGIAHDLRSPLVSIEGFSRLLRDDMQNRKEENVQEDIRLLESGVKRMQCFLDDTLEYSRSGQVIKRTDDVSFVEMAREVLTEFSEQISSLGAAVSLAKAFPKICVDRSRIKEVLTNLVQNSIKYRDTTVPLKIEIGHFLLNNETVFFARDNGTGIAASEAEKVFALFYRGTAEGEGSGIGLAVAKKIIEAHGGRIWVQEGSSGNGTTMCFTLPEPGKINKDNTHGKN